MQQARHARHYHEDLLVGEALQLGSRVQPLRPRFLADAATLVRFILVQRAQSAEVDLLVQQVLERGYDIIVVIMNVIVGLGVLFVVVVMALWALLWALRHGSGVGDLCWRGSL